MRLAPSTQAETPSFPTCDLCGGDTRLVGIEPHPSLNRTDLRTFVCKQCNHVRTDEVPLAHMAG